MDLSCLADAVTRSTPAICPALRW